MYTALQFAAAQAAVARDVDTLTRAATAGLTTAAAREVAKLVAPYDAEGAHLLVNAVQVTHLFTGPVT